MRQLTLDITAESKLDMQFQEFHQANPHVYETLVRLARELKVKGHKHIGVKMLRENMRFQMMMQTLDPSGWKLNNSYTSRYARLIMEREPDLAGAFEIRELKS